MTHTLEDLKSGKLIGTKRLKLACGLSEFPEEIFSLAGTLEILDLSDNLMSELPERMSELTKLKIIFFANNKFEVFPKVLAKCPVLDMIGFKSNQITTVAENAFPPLLRWLILTDNKIGVLPSSIGKAVLLQKCALSGNLIKELPVEMSHCVNLELLRISANQLHEIPTWLFELPKLSWVAFSGNPASYKPTVTSDLASYAWNEFQVKELLGEGASGLISKANWKNKNEAVAVKVFKGAVTSDGWPEDEMAVSIAVGTHPSLIRILGKIKEHPDKKNGLLMKLISSDYSNLGNPPSLQTCSRDTFDEEHKLSVSVALNIVKSITSVGVHLHSKGVNHGDLYAHNIMKDNTDKSLLGDFGAGSFYDTSSTLSHNIERVEVRALGCLLEDLYGLVDSAELKSETNEKWQQLIFDCMQSEVGERPSFGEVFESVNQLLNPIF